MTTQEVASRYMELEREGKSQQIQEELYADDCESIEPAHASGFASVKGKAAIMEKGKQFGQLIEEVHGGYSSEPVVGGNFFSMAMGMDVTFKGQGRMKMDEIAVFEVKDGKIVKVQFFY